MTKYVYDQEDILFELDENDQIKARYTHGPGIDEPISVDRDTDSDGVLDVTYFYHYDGLGSIVAITDALGNIVQTYVYDTFGNIVQQSGNIENVYTYTGREWDAEASLYYYRARYYDPTLGRFINGDPIGFAGGDVNFYVYVQNNPVNFIDPLGLITPGRISNFGTSDVSFGFLVSHEFLSATTSAAGIAATYLAVSGYGLPASAPFAGVALFSNALDKSLHSDDIIVDSTAAVVAQVVASTIVAPPFNLLTDQAIQSAASAVNSLFDGPLKKQGCSN